jgi:hypothetical protein
MNELTDHEKALLEVISPQHQELMYKLSPAERRSLAQHVTVENVKKIESWIGTDEEIENMLFWDKGGKYDDPEWQALKPFDSMTAELYEAAKKHYAGLRKEAVESQRRSDLTLYSQFNSGLLYTGLAGAIRCNERGEEDPPGGFFKGIEFRAIGSVEEYVNPITLYPLDNGEIEIHFGARKSDRPEGIWVFTGDSHSLLQLVMLHNKVLPKKGFEARVETPEGKVLTFDEREIRRSAMAEGKVERISFGSELKLFASKRASTVDEALEVSDALSTRFYERFGLETESYKIGKKYGNFFIMRDENFHEFMPETPVEDDGLVLLTATLVCRRCRRELNEFRDLAKYYPHIKAVLVNLSSPQFSFYDRVFADMGGGDPDEFRKNAAGVTPFIIIYAPNEEGILTLAEYVATGKSDNTPSVIEAMPILDKYFKGNDLSAQQCSA